MRALVANTTIPEVSLSSLCTTAARAFGFLPLRTFVTMS